MRGTSPRRAVCGAWLIGLLSLAAFARGGRGEVRILPDQGPDLNKAQFYGVESCKQCHEEARTKTDFVRLTEYTTWKNEDKHSQAYAVLLEDRSQRMGSLLGCDVSKDARCLNCHAMNFPEERRNKDNFKIEDGVSCDGCHGPAEYWVGAHFIPSWRRKTQADKSRLGMIDMDDPIRRTEMCLSCHIGNTAEGKVVTHAMYAAGHPPLPGIEIAAFSHQLPRHWRAAKDVPFFQEAIAKKEAASIKNYRLDGMAYEQTHMVVTSSVVALRESLKFLASQAEAGPKAWPDYAHHDCYACHQDLRVPSWRQLRGFAGSPGRPPLRPWPTALVKLALSHAGRKPDELAKGQLRLQEALSIQPFGEPKAVAAAARAVAGWADQVIKELEQRPYDRAAVQRLLRELATVAKAEYPDYDSARQIGWAFRAMYDELQPKPAHDAKIQAILGQLTKDLKLQLPSGKERQIMQELPESLQRISDYDPNKFKEALRQLLQGLQD